MQDPQAVIKTKVNEAFDFNKSTWDSHAVFNIQVSLSLRLTYEFNRYALHRNSRLHMIMSLLLLSIIKGCHCCQCRCEWKGSSCGSHEF